MTRALRHLTDAEIEIWLKVAETVSPRPDSRLPAASAPPPPPAPPRPAAAGPTPRRHASPSYSPPMAVAAPAPAPAAFERRFKRRIAGGRVGIDAALDLHGMNQMQAHGALHGFLFDAQHQGARLVLVVTGKGHAERFRGLAEPPGPGVLRRAVPLWLRDRPLRAIVVGFEEAAQHHGGAGALYVRLRRPLAPS